MQDWQGEHADREQGGLREQARKICGRQCTGTLGEAVLRAGHSIRKLVRR